MLQRLDEAAQTLGFDSRSDLMKLAIKSFVEHVERHGGAWLPPDWQDMLADMDGRASRYEKTPRRKRDK